MTISNATHINRRTFLASSTGLTFSLAVGGSMLMSQSAQAADPAIKLNAWITIGTDNTVTMMVPTAEMGQGTTPHCP